MKTPAREQLTVFVAGDEVAGFTVYGLARRHSRRVPAFPVDLWPDGTNAEESLLHGETWEVPCWDVAVGSWPTGAAWLEAVRGTLEHVVEQGCVVAWLGGEGRPFCDPPGLFDPACMSGGVLASLTAGGDFRCPLDPDEPIKAISDTQMLELRGSSAGLSNAAD
ncbi:MULTISPECIES: hypothetical protein [unclassified Saccharothrix]|uniref:hypothetical protein n=1 Tax=unclassified Saccharothrix TaxID=2593673 RepID=UPI00307F4C32